MHVCMSCMHLEVTGHTTVVSKTESETEPTPRSSSTLMLPLCSDPAPKYAPMEAANNLRIIFAPTYYDATAGISILKLPTHHFA